MSRVSETTNPLRRAARILADAEIWVVGGAVAISLAFPRFLAAAVITAAAFFVVRWAAYGRPSVRTPADWPIAILTLLSAANALWVTALPEITQVQVLRLWSGIGLYYSVVNWGSRENRLRWLVRGLLLAGLLLCLAAPFSVDWATGKLPFVPQALYSRFQVLVADSIHSNVLGGTLALIIPVGIAVWLFGGADGWERWAALGLSAIMGGATLLSLSRGAVMAVGTAVIVLLILRGRWGWLALVGAAAAAGFVVYRFGVNRVIDLALSGGAVSGLDGRLEIWSRAEYMLQDFPFTGIGMGSFMQVADRLYPFSMYSEGSIEHAHNLFLQVGVDLGIPGLLAWAATLLAAAYSAWLAYRAGRKGGNPLLAAVGAGTLGSMTALVVHGMTDAVTWGMVRPAPLVWFVWGMAVAGGILSSEVQRSQNAGSTDAPVKSTGQRINGSEITEEDVEGSTDVQQINGSETANQKQTTEC